MFPTITFGRSYAMKYFPAIVALVLLLGYGIALASVDDIEIDPKSIGKLPLQFAITSEWLPDKAGVQFDVTVREGKGKLTEAGLRKGVMAHLEFVEPNREIWFRALSFDRQENTITCRFCVSLWDLQDEELCFGLWLQSPRYASADLYYCHLHNFLPRAGEKGSAVK